MNCAHKAFIEPCLDRLESRILMAVADFDWSGIWNANGYAAECEVNRDRNGNPTTCDGDWDPEKHKLVFTPTGGGDYHIAVPDVGETFDVSGGGNVLTMTDQYWEDGEYCVDSIRLQTIGDNAALMIFASGAFTDNSLQELSWSFSYIAMLTRGNVAIPPRPFAGQYTSHHFDYDIDDQPFNGQSELEWGSENRDGQIVAMGGAYFQAGPLDDPSEFGVFRQRGSLLVAEESQRTANTYDGDCEVILRGPDDSLVLLGGAVEYRRIEVPSGQQNVPPEITYSVWTGVWVNYLTPMPGSEYQPDLTPQIMTSDIPNTLVSGDKCKVQAKIANIGTAPATGVADFRLVAQFAGGEEIVLGVINNAKLNIAPGKAGVLTFPVSIQQDLVGEFTLRVDCDTGREITEINETNNTLVDARLYRAARKAGVFDGRLNVPLTVWQGPVQVTYTLTGGGWLEVTGPNFDSVTLHNTTPKSQLTIRTFGGEAQLANLDCDGPLKGISAATTILTGPAVIGPDPTGQATTLSLFGVAGLGDIQSDMPIKSFSAGYWSSGGRIEAPWIGSLGIVANAKKGQNGNFAGGLLLDGDGAPKGVALGSASVSGQSGGLWNIGGVGHVGTLRLGSTVDGWQMHTNGTVKSVTVAGSLTGNLQANSLATLNIGGNLERADLRFDQSPDVKLLALGTLNVKGAVINSQILADGNMGVLTMLRTENSAVLAGAPFRDDNGDGLADLLDSATDNWTHLARIKKLTVKGDRARPYSFEQTNVLASRIDNVFFAAPNTDLVGGSAFGVACSSYGVISYATADGTTTYKGVNGPFVFAPPADGNLEIRIIAPPIS